MKYLAKGLAYLQSMPRKVILWTLIGGTILIILLKFLAAGATLKAKELNLGALIQDAIDKYKLQLNKDKIKELDKKPSKDDLKTDPKEVEEFYKKRK